MDLAAILEQIAKIFGDFQQPVATEPAENTEPRFDKTILLDPGHGLYLTDGVWNFQRDDWWGIIEDVHVMHISKRLLPKLQHWFKKVHYTRPMPGTPEGDTPGVSGHPRWKEGALYYLRAILDGHPSAASICEIGGRERYKDINCRPLYAEHLKVDAMVGVHINAGPTDSPTAHGISCLYRTDDKESMELAEFINNELTPKFHSRGLKPRKDDLSFFRRSTMPAALIECLFFTNKEDNARLHNEMNLVFLANAIAEGTRKFFESKEA